MCLLKNKIEFETDILQLLGEMMLIKTRAYSDEDGGKIYGLLTDLSSCYFVKMVTKSGGGTHAKVYKRLLMFHSLLMTTTRGVTIGKDFKTIFSFLASKVMNSILSYKKFRGINEQLAQQVTEVCQRFMATAPAEAGESATELRERVEKLETLTGRFEKQLEELTDSLKRKRGS